MATLEGLKSAAAAGQVEITVLREEAEVNEQRITDLESTRDDLWDRLNGVSACRAVSTDAEVALSTWETFLETFLEYLETEVGSDAELALEASG